jgi:hypothetical protein
LAAPSNVAPVSGAAALKLAPSAGAVLDRSGHFLNLNIGGVALPAAGQDISSARPNMVVADLTPGIRLELAHGRNFDAFGDLFSSPATLSSAYLSGTSSSVGASFALSDNVSFSIGQSSWGFGAFSNDQPSQFSRDLAERMGANIGGFGTTSANLNWNFADWGGLAITASSSIGNASLLGIVPGSLSGVGADTTALGISARIGFGEGWVTTVAYSGGVSQIDLSRNHLIGNTDSVSLQAFGVALAKQGLFGADALGIAVSRPSQVYGGSLGAALANSQARESDVELGYVTSFLGGSLALQANAAYQVNAAGAQGQNAVAGVARAKLKF